MRKWVLFSLLGLAVGLAAIWHVSHKNSSADSGVDVVSGAPEEWSLETLRNTNGEIVMGGGSPTPIPEAKPAEKVQTPTLPELSKTEKITPAVTPTTKTAEASSPTKQAWDEHYKIQAGDTLGGIAKKKYGSAAPSIVDAIMKKNSLKNPKQLKVGMEILLPDPTTLKSR